MFGRDKTSLSGRLHRLSEGVFKHRAFRLGAIMARTRAGASSPISWPGLALRASQAGTSTSTRCRPGACWLPLWGRWPRVRHPAPPAPASAACRRSPHSLVSSSDPTGQARTRRPTGHRPRRVKVGHQEEPRRARFRKPPHPARATRPAPAGKAQARTKQPGRCGPVRAGAGTESKPEAAHLRGKEGREHLFMNEFLSLLSYLSPQSPRIVPTLSPHPLNRSRPLSIGVLSRSGHLSPRPHKN